MTRKKEVLKNGLTVMYDKRQKSCIGPNLYSGCLSINIGHINEPKLGLAGLFEKTLLLQTAGIIPVFGGTMTAYTAGGPSLKEVFKKLSAVFNATIVNDEFVEKAKQRITEETNYVAMQTMRRMKLLYKHTAFGADLVRPTEEFLEKLNALTTEDVRNFANTYYTASNVVLVISGPETSIDEVVELAEQSFGHIETGTKLQDFTGAPYTGGFGRITINDNVTRLMFGWDVSSLSIDDSPTVNVMMSMFLNMLECAYSQSFPDTQVEFKIAGYYGARTMRAYISSPTAKAKELTNIFVSILNKICDTWASAEILERARNNAMTEKLDKYEKSDNGALEIAWQLIGRGNMYDVSNRINSIYETTDGVVRAMAEKVFRSTRATYIVATSPEDEPYSYHDFMTAIDCEFLLDDNE